MPRLYSIIAIIIASILIPSVVNAQSQPIILLIDGDLWSMASPGETPFRETYWGYNRGISISPDGQFVAYSSFPEWLVERELAGIEPINYDQHPPTNIWLMEINSRTFTRIVNQDEPVGENARFIRRTRPIWSPDSRQIAWLESEMTGGLKLMVYDLATNSTSTGPGNLPGINGDAGMIGVTETLSWGSTLAFDAFSYSLPEGFGNRFGRLLTVLDIDGIDAQRLNADVQIDDSLNVQEWRWVEYRGQWFIGLRYVYGWQFWDYQNNEFFESDTMPFLQTLSGEGLKLSYTSDTRLWTIHQPDGNQFDLPERSATPALSPDGTSVIYVRIERRESGTVVLFEQWQNGITTPLLDIEAESFPNQVLWTPVIWRLEGELFPIASPTPIPTATVSQG